MPFKIKDLLIDIEAAEAVAKGKEVCVYRTGPCNYPTPCKFMSDDCLFHTCGIKSPCLFHTCGIKSPCLFHTCGPMTPYQVPPYEEAWRIPIEPGEIGEMRPEDLGALKQRLEQALEVVKTKHAELEARTVREPTTHEEITALESKLEDALKELRARKAKLPDPGK